MLTSRFHDTQTLQYTVNLTIDKIQTMKLINVQSIPLGVSFSKTQSSKLEHLFCHVSVKREVRALIFELETAFENVTPSGTFLDPLSIIKVQPIPLGVTFSNAVSKLKAPGALWEGILYINCENSLNVFTGSQIVSQIAIVH